MAPVFGYDSLMKTSFASDRNRVIRQPSRASYDQQSLYAVLDSSVLCHVGFVVDGQVFVIPTAYARDGERLLLHGSAASRMMKRLAEGEPCCVTVSHLDGFVLAKSAFHHSVNYRSAVVFGKAIELSDPVQKAEALRLFMEKVTPGRWQLTRPPAEQELRATSVLSVQIEDASVKTRSGGPIEDSSDLSRQGWSGVIPIHSAAGLPQAAPESEPGAAPPPWRFDDLRPIGQDERGH